RLQLRGKRERGTAVRAEPLDQPGLPVPAATDGPVARAAESLVLGDLRVRQHGGGRIPGRYRGDVHQPGAQVPAGRPGAARPATAAAGAAAAGAAADGAAAARGATARAGRRYRARRPRRGPLRGPPPRVPVTPAARPPPPP